MKSFLPLIVIAALLAPTRAHSDSPPLFVDKWGSAGSGPGQFSYPEDIAVGPNGALYVADERNSRIEKFDMGGAFLGAWGEGGFGDGQFDTPVGVACDSEEHIYVVEAGNQRVQEFLADGTFVTKWGNAGTEDGRFDQPWGIAVAPNGDVYVADTGNNRVQRFTSGGVFLSKWGGAGSAIGEFQLPIGIHVDAAGSVYVADTGNSRIQKFTAAGVFVREWGSPGSGDGQFGQPVRLTTDPSGDVYVVDRLNQCVQKFSEDGAFLARWGEFGIDNGDFWNPHGIALQDFIYVAEEGGNRVQMFGPVTTGIQEDGGVGRPVGLGQPWPNPSRSSVSAVLRVRPYVHAGTAAVRVDVLDIRGRLVRSLLEGQLPAGDHLLHWDGRDRQGRGSAAGLYWLRAIVNGREVSTARLVRLGTLRRI